MDSMDFEIHNELNLITMNTVILSRGFCEGDGSKPPKIISTQVHGIHGNCINGQCVYII